MATVTASQTRAAQLNIVARKQRSLWRDGLERLLRNKASVAGLVIIGFFGLVALLAPLIAPYDPICYFYVGSKVGCGVQSAASGPVLKDPIWMANSDPRFIFGTDQIGRDILTRLMYGARVSMVVGFIPVILILIIGGTVGLVAGYNGGWVDNLLMRFTDIIYAFPDLLFLIIIMATLRQTNLGQLGGGLPLIFGAIALVNWVGMARLVRGQVLSLKEKEFVEAARTIGASPARIMVRHLMPNALAPVIVAIAFAVPGAIFAEAGLSFLGIGIVPPTPSWGVMINEGYAVFYGSPWNVLLPAGCIALVLLSFTFVGDGLRDALDPRMKL